MSCCNNLLEIHRGDTLKIPVRFFKDGRQVVYGKVKEIVFTVKKHIRDDSVVFTRKASLVNNEYLVKIEPGDTKNAEFGNYVFDVQLTDTGGDVKTLVYGTFKIKGEVS